MNTGIGALGPLALAGLALMLGSCGTVPGKREFTRGDMMIARGEAVTDLGKMWNEGRQLVDRAGALTMAGARLKRRGQYNLDKGYAIARQARAIIEQQQREYARFAETVGPAVTLNTAREQRDDLDRVVERWRDGWKRLQEGRERIEKGRSRIRAGEAKIAKADSLRYRGRALMRRAEESYNLRQPVPAGQGRE